jgi:hypothetical protein
VKLKLDENLGTRGMELQTQDGHDVCTGTAQSLTSATDEEIAARCAKEDRGLVTLDLANPFRFPPESSAGIAVLRGPARLTLEKLLQTPAVALRSQDLSGHLGSVEAGRVFQRP